MSDLELVKKLRETSGAGMLDCQKALTEADGDLGKALEILKKKGLEKAGKKAERSTKEGLIAFAKEGKKLAVVAVACETDFVSGSPDFIKAVQEMAQKLLTTNKAAWQIWAEDKIKKELMIKIGENMRLNAFELIEGDLIGSYLHSNKKVASAVVLAGGGEELANDLAMQVAAMSPKYLSPADIPSAELEKEKEIYREQIKESGKPAAVLEKIIEGKLGKYYSDFCLLKQQFIKDDTMTVEQLLGEVKVVKFIRYSI